MKYLSFFVLLSVSFTSYGQNLWTKGEIILKDGTVLSGEIQDRQWVVNPTEIEFRISGGEIKTYKPEDLREFSTARAVKFRSMFVVYDGDAQVAANYPPAREPQVVIKEQSFVEVLVDAPLALYHLLDKRGRKHFFIADSTGVKELVDRWFGTGQGTKHYEFYKQQLTLITNDCPKLQTTISKTSYTEQQLILFFRKLNECKGFTVTEDVKLENQERRPPSFGLSTQAFLSQIRYNYAFVVGSSPMGPINPGGTYYALQESAMGPLNFGFGAFAEFYDRKRPDRLSLFNELGFQTVSQDYVSYQAISLLIAARISIPEKSGERHYAMFGVNNLYKINTTITDLPHGLEDDKLMDEYSLGAALGIGKSFSLGSFLRTNVELRYTYDVLHSASTGFKGAHNIGLGLQFYKH
jgi:hypothetical protein